VDRKKKSFKKTFVGLTSENNTWKIKNKLKKVTIAYVVNVKLLAKFYHKVDNNKEH